MVNYKMGRRKNAVQFTFSTCWSGSPQEPVSKSVSRPGAQWRPSSLSASSTQTTQKSHNFGRQLAISRPSHPLGSDEKRRGSSDASIELYSPAKAVRYSGREYLLNRCLRRLVKTMCNFNQPFQNQPHDQCTARQTMKRPEITLTDADSIMESCAVLWL